MESVDVAFRLGYEQGAQAAQMQQMQDQAQQMAEQQAQEAQMAANGMGPDGQPQPGQEGGDSGAQIQEDSRGVGQQAQGAGGTQAQGGSELDQHIGELEGLMAKAEYGTENWEVLKKSLDGLKNIKVSFDLKKNEALIKSIGENLRKKKPLVLNPRAKHNLGEPQKAALSLQHKIVGEIMDTWDKEAKGIPTQITEILQSEGLSKKE